MNVKRKMITVLTKHLQHVLKFMDHLFASARAGLLEMVLHPVKVGELKTGSKHESGNFTLSL